MTADGRELEVILAEFGVTPVEYEAMLCSYYEEPLRPREMASTTVVYNYQCGCKYSGYTADEFLEAIYGMIDKGWLRIQTGSDCPASDNSEAIPTREEFPPLPGTVGFTKAGYLLHRQLLARVHGGRFVQEADSFYLQNRELREFCFYAQTKRLCRNWVRELLVPQGLFPLLPAPAEIISASRPERIGQWRPSKFLTLPKGYSVTVKYKRLPRRKFDVPELKLKSTLDYWQPVGVAGTIAGERFVFHDEPTWTSLPGEDEQAECTIFRWRFKILGKSQLDAPQEAILRGESKAAGGVAIPNVLFGLVEHRDKQRKHMLSFSQAKRLMARCAAHYLNRGKSDR